MTIRSQNRREPEDTASIYARNFRRIYPRFRGDRALFLDMEGVLGWEVGLSMCAPKLAKGRKFVGVVCTPGQDLDPSDLPRALKLMQVNELDVEWVVTFSAQGRSELTRIKQWMGRPVFGAAKEVNLKKVMSATPELTQAARTRALVHRATGPRNKRPRFESSLTVLEREFGIVRPPSVWVHKKLYGRRRRAGSFSPMEAGRAIQQERAEPADMERLGQYMWWEVGTMAEITRMIEKKEA
jgi:hypothetical protein